jgi:hypothetical protein
VLLQIAALMERCKRNEEDAAEKARTVDALRRKLALAGRPCSAGSTAGSGGMLLQAGAAGSTGLGLGERSMLLNTGGSSALYSGASCAAGPGAGGLSALRRSWAAETGSPSGSPTRSVGSSYGYN